jgi:carbon storage regulator
MEVIVLVLSRRVRESIVIPQKDGSVITITVLKFKDGRVSVGIDAPREIPIVRQELLEQASHG